MARMAAPVAVAAMEVGVDEDDLGRMRGAVHQADEVGQHRPLGELDGEMVDTIPGRRESPVTATGMPQNAAEGGQVSGDGLNRGPARAAGDPDGEDGLLDGPPVNQAATCSSPRDASLEPFQGGQVEVFLKKLEAKQLGSGDHEDVRHRSGWDPQVLEHEIVPLLPRGGEADGPQVDEDSMSLEVGDVIETVVRRRLGSPRGGGPTSADRIGKGRRSTGHISLGGKNKAPTVPI
jgi:hypothetical protein